MARFFLKHGLFLLLTLFVLYGVACSLSARTVPGALVPTFLIPVALIVGTVLLIVLFQWAHAFVLWFATAGLLVYARSQLRRRTRWTSGRSERSMIR